MLQSRATSPCQRAFTLMEMCVALSILTVLVLMLSEILTRSGGAWQLTEARKERLQTERALSDFMGSELQSALLPVNRPSQTDLQFVVNPTSISAKYRNRDAIFWQMPLATDQTMGDVAEVGYFVKWSITDPSHPRAALCRIFVNPTDSDHYKIHAAPTGWINDSLLDAMAPAVATSGDDSYLGLFAENVLGLWLTCLDASGLPIAANDAGQPFTGASFDSRQGFTASDGLVKTRGALPSAVDLSLALIDARTAGRVGPAEQAAITKLTADLTVLNASDFVTRSLTTPGCEKLRAGLRSYQTRIYLQGSR